MSNIGRATAWLAVCLFVVIALAPPVFASGPGTNAPLGGMTAASPAVTPSVLDPGVTQVVSGPQHTCALSPAGAVRCWGYNGFGQLGDGSTTRRLTPVNVNGLAGGVVALAAGHGHTCALTTAGGVKCWGGNAYGQLGDGTTTDRLVAVNVSGLNSGVAALVAGSLHTCALTTAGGVKCWGSNGDGQLGDGSRVDRPTAIGVSGLASGVVAVAAGGSHTCAVTTAGGVKCWGWNGDGQLGDGTTTDRLTAVDVSGLAGGVAALAAGGYHTCALTAAGAAKCWGWNGYGQLGDGGTTDHATPADVAGLSSGVAALAAGANHTCALTAAGGAKCWGHNGSGRLGDGSTIPRLSAVDVSGLTDGVAALAAGGAHTCAVTAAGGAKCWGGNVSGQLGDATTTDRLAAVSVSGLASGVVAFAAGFAHTCALTTAGGVKCWGSNSAGQLGDGSTTDQPVAIDVNGLASGVMALSAGSESTCALTAVGGVKCWGRNSVGQLGDGSTIARLTAVDVSGLTSGVTALASGDYHTCALTTVGGVKCWGHNALGQLGDGSRTNRLTAVDVSGLTSGVVALAAGVFHTCAVTTAGGVKCWGSNVYGQLGDATTTDRLTAVNVSGLASGVAALAAGRHHTCALTTTGGVKCWGYNGAGELGDSNWSLTPVDVSGLASGVAALAAGEAHTCALTLAGGVKCWGSNAYDRLGDGSGIDHTIPVDVSGLASGIAALAAGVYHNCVASVAGAAKCWGSNDLGQLGDGSMVHQPTPVPIRAGQSIAFAPAEALRIGGSMLLSASAESGGTVVFDTWTPSTCSLSGNRLTATATAPALCGVRASQAGGRFSAGGSAAPAPQQLRLLRIVPMPDLSLGKTHTGDFAQGQSGAIYRLTVSNVGLAATSGVVKVTEALPAGLNLTALSGAGWSCDVGGAACTRNDALAGGASYPPITVTVDVAATTPAGTVVNTAAVSGGGMDADTHSASDPTTILPVAASIAVMGGTQAATVDTAFANPLVALVKDRAGDPMPGVVVSFAAPGSGASAVLSASSATTDASGQASVTATANTTAGSYLVSASVGGVTPAASFTLTNAAGPAAALTISGGTPQSATVDTPFGVPLGIYVTDTHGNAVAGAVVAFVAPGSGASAGLSASSATTDASGQASVTATANTTAGSYAVGASVSGVTPTASFALTNTAGAAAALATSGGTPQSTMVDTTFTAPLRVRVTDVHGNAVAGTMVTFSAPGSGASAVLSASSAKTDASGQASVTATANTTAGSYVVDASVSGITPTTSFALTNTAGAAAILTSTGGTPQSATVGTGFTVPLGVRVTDAHGNALAGVTVAFVAPDSGASAVLSAPSATTDVSGQASVMATANTTAGSYVVRASVAGIASTASFALTNTPVDVMLSISIDADHDHAQYGHPLEYQIMVHNAGSMAARHVSVRSVLAPQLDAAYTHWICLDAVNGACVASGEGELDDGDVTVPALGSVSWVITAPIRLDAEGEVVVTQVRALSPDQGGQIVGSASTTLVLFRDGFDSAGGAGAPGTLLLPRSEPLRADDALRLAMPPARTAGVATVLDARAADGSSFRLDRLTRADMTWLRLVAIERASHEHVAPWQPADAGVEVLLSLVVSGPRAAVVLVNGTHTMHLDLGLVEAPTYALRVVEQAAVRP